MSNLVKGMWVTVNVEDARVIDNNELADQKIQATYEEEQRRRIKLMADSHSEMMGDGDGGGFMEGLNAEQLDQIDPSESSDIPSEMSLGDFPGEDSGQEKENARSRLMRGTVPPNTQKEIDQILEDAQVQANQIVTDARNEAQDIMQKAQEDGQKKGYDEGYQQGLADAEVKGAENARQKEEELSAEYDRMVASIEPEMVETLCRIYEHVFDVSFREDKKIILHLLQTALARIESSGNLLVHISPDDYDMIQDAKENLMQNITSPDISMELVEDSTLKENECIIETDGGIFDCSVGVEIEELGRKLRLLSYDRKRN